MASNRINNESKNTKYCEHDTTDSSLICTHCEADLSGSFGILFEKLKEQTIDSINKLKYYFINANETLNVHIEYIKEEIEIRIESIKIELDVLRDKFHEKLEAFKDSQLNNKHDGEDFKTLETKLNQFKDTISNNVLQNKETFLDYNKKLKHLKFQINRLNERKNRIFFDASNEKIDETYIGRLSVRIENYCLINDVFEKKILQSPHKTISMNAAPNELCVLSNERLVSLCFNERCLFVYDVNLKLIKIITSIGAHEFRPVSITTDKQNRIYLTNKSMNSSVLMTDLDFNLIKSFNDVHTIGQANGIGYYQNHVYICDLWSKRVKVLTADLEYVQSFQVDNYPWRISVIENIASIDFVSSTTLCFYDLETGLLKHKYNGCGHRRLSVLNSVFYEFNDETKNIECYNKEGIHFKSIKLKNFESFYKMTWDACVVVFKDNIYVSNYHDNKLYKIEMYD